MVLAAEETRRPVNLMKIFLELNTTEKCVKFAEERNLILKTKLCSKHKKPMILSGLKSNPFGIFQCRKSPCRDKSVVSRAKGTWFDNVKISLPQIFYLMYAYAQNWSYDNTRFENCLKDTPLSLATIADWFSYCRETMVAYQIDHRQARGKIGGPGKIVQIDRSKFGKRKFNKGKNFEGHWVIGMVEDGSEDLRIEFCSYNACSADLLVTFIKKHVLEGTKIRTDFLQANDCLEDHGYELINYNFSGPDNPIVVPDRTHTHCIEPPWRMVKSFYCEDRNHNHPSVFSDKIFEFLWRNNIEKNHLDPFEKLIEAIQYVYKP